MSVKEELLPDADCPHPHTLDDVCTARLVESLTYEDCRDLYPKVRSLPPSEARSVVGKHPAAGRSSEGGDPRATG